MNKRIQLYISALASSVVLFASTVSAEVFVAPFAGYSFSASEFDVTQTETDEQGKVKIAESEHYGVMFGVTTKDPGNIYFLYSSQSTDLRAGGNFSADSITDLTVDYFHVGGSLFFPNGNLKPYVTASVGMTNMRPSGDYSNESRFSMGFGAGLEYELTPAVALFADARGYATFMSSDNALFCNGSQCVWNIHADIMWQGQVNAGIKLSF
ncbi:porin family protein [Shewanella eurypsychrophilus]|uniref:Porin family protein n=1 Tax=Shewanella eurypsychrophilus TaxID=2593656 RepID=A0ABX6V5M4_9GAMM|nr:MULTISPECIES: outer membrane beta-barrel protein [Shewanella]QFU21546.1 outer membrane beta-barrel protein [Shewanella sp. YLB-09]QPG56836.1 porin family protein [Shewanella eurypsychrophilus]